MKRNWTRRLIGGLSITSALFVFQACYGTLQDYGLDLLIEGQVKAGNTGLPIKGIKVSVVHNMQFEVTGEDGKFSLYTENVKDLLLEFQDIDAEQNGSFIKKDTTLNVVGRQVYVDIKMKEK